MLLTLYIRLYVLFCIFIVSLKLHKGFRSDSIRVIIQSSHDCGTSTCVAHPASARSDAEIVGSNPA
jgi:hypothetical protein